MPNSARLPEQLERARDLGFLGPGPVEDHLVHSAAFVDALSAVAGTVVDLGAGGGVPGLVVAVQRPDLRVVLVESMAKRCRFLRAAVAALEVDAIVEEGRAEELGRGPWRATVDAVVARGFASPAATAECAAPLLRVGGLLVVSEPPEADGRWPAEGVAQLGLARGERLTGPPALQLLWQRAVCPPEYPRRVGRPASRPLF